MSIERCCCQIHIVKYYFKSFSILFQSISHAMRARRRINMIFGRLACDSEITSVFGCKIVQKYTKRDELGKIQTSAVRGPINNVF